MSLICPRCSRVLEYSGEPPTFCGYCGSRLNLAATIDFDHEAETVAPREAVPGPADVPEQVGGYRLLRPLGEGGMGKVYEAEDVASGRHVALKLIAPDFAASPETVERFRQEGRLASAITHPRCVFVLAADEDAGRPYIVMELMPGDTLETLVRKQGPLPPEQAVARILDVIDGLREAHRLGVVHRDVKPSNCFLEADGRVKVGDFGLAKSLVNQAHLTRTGTFLGTLLYCSPEQVRGQAVDRQSDVYSVAATLYYLLTGQAPFQTGDAAATLARIVADPAPPMRGLRPELSPALDRVVLRGLERDRTRRWRDLDEFHAALLPFAPGQLSIGGVGLRFGAYLLDSLLLAPVHAPPGLLLLLTGPALDPVLWRGSAVVAPAVSLLYFALSEGWWGCTLGKRWLRLRVCTVPGSDVPGLRRALLRIGTWYLLMGLPGLVVRLLPAPAELLKAGRTFYLVNCFQLVTLVAGILALLSTMRARNGYRCLHDFVSGTRVVRLPEPEGRHALPAHHLAEDLVEAVGVPPRLGNYIVRGAFRESAGQRVLLAEEPGLGRPALLWLRPASEPPLPPERRDCARASRLRWLAAGRNGDVQWDAFLAPAGCPLQSLVRARGRLSWAEARPLLVRLTEELVAATDDDTLPERLTVMQVWIHGDQQVLLLDVPFGGSPAEPTEGGTREPAPLAARSLLRKVAVLALEGRHRTAGAPADAVRAPVPVHAARFLARLLGAPPPLENADQVRAELAAMRGRPTHVTRPRRAAQLALQAAFLAVGLGFMTVSGCLPTFVPPLAVRTDGLLRDQSRADLEEGAWREFAVAALNPAPTARVGALVQADADLLLAERLRERIRHAFREHDARLEAMSPPMRAYMRAVELQAEPQIQAKLRARREQQVKAWPPGYHVFFRQRALSDAMQPGPPVAEDQDLTRAITLVVPVWPVVWVLWAFALRGSLSYRILGLTLVRPDGRPAPRWRCAWRALLVWAPITALLVASIWLDCWYWPTWRAGAPSVWLLRLSLLTWWAVWPILGLDVLLALRRPAQALHDRLAGTYLVPR
jgi:hypothetical protein